MIIREAKIEDAKWVLDIRNSELVRNMSIKNKSIIKFNDHLRWFKKKLNQKKKQIGIV